MIKLNREREITPYVWVASGLRPVKAWAFGNGIGKMGER
jgi:hypothetical protein